MSLRHSARGAAVGFVLCAAGAGAQPGGMDRVRIDYSAPEGCPPRAALLDLVRARVGSSWEAHEGELARTIDVRVQADGARMAGRIDFVDDQGRAVARAVAADTCAELVSALALVTAFAIDSRVAPEAAAPDAPGGAPEPVPPPAPPLPGSPAPRAPPAPSPRPELELGASAVGLFGAGPHLALGVRGFAGAGWEGGPDFRIGVDVAGTGPSARDSRFSLLAGILDVCPVALELGSARLLPCAGVSAGALGAEGRGAGGAYERGQDSAGWFAFRAGGRVQAYLDVLFVEATAEARIPTATREFVIEPAEPGEPPTRVYQTPPVAAGVGLGVGVRL